MSKHRILLVGCGGIADAWLTPAQTFFQEQGKIVALVDLRPEAAKAKAEKYQMSDTWIGSCLKSGIEEAKPDVVFDCTIPEGHYSVTKIALEAGCHVLGEKPVASESSQAMELIKLADEHERVFSVIQNRRYLGSVRRVIELIQSGLIGDVHTINADFFMAAHFDGFRRDMPHVLLADMAIHTFDSARYLSGKNATSVFCHEFNPDGAWCNYGGSAHALFKMEDGVVFNYRGSWAADGHHTDWNSAWRIIGTKGTILWDGDSKIEAEFLPGDRDLSQFFQDYKKETYEPLKLEEYREGHAGLIGDFFQAIETNTNPLTVASDNVHSFMMVERAIESAEKCREIDF
ncbi:MAG: Gfo/Idh/MocA family oxidoreductase [Verrucomicrobiota bacterium]